MVERVGMHVLLFVGSEVWCFLAFHSDTYSNHGRDAIVFQNVIAVCRYIAIAPDADQAPQSCYYFR